MVSYTFPPTGGAGVQRIVKFIKYMRNYGYEPVVLTVKNASVPLHDESLLKDIPEGITIIKAKTLEPSYKVKNFILEKRKKEWKNYFELIIRNLLIPDPQVLWYPGIIKNILQLRKKKPDLIFVTAPPFSSLIAGIFAKIILKRPLVSDFRDEWVGFLAGSFWSNLSGNKRISLFLEKLLERFVVKASDLIIVASPGYVDTFKLKYGRLVENKIHCITNGYDPSDFSFGPDRKKYADILDKDKFNIVYMGTVWPAVSLKYFLDGAMKTESKELINLIVIGRITANEEPVIESYSNNLNIIKLGYCYHEKAVQIANRADALLVTLSPVEGTERIIPAKIFEYMAFRKPIIAIVPNGSAGDILKEYSGSLIIHPLDKENISIKCQELINKWQSKCLDTINDNIEKHTREMKTKTLCSVLDGIL